MLHRERKEKVLAKLATARGEIEDAVSLATPVARYDAVVLPEGIRGKLTTIVDDLNALIRHVEGTQ